MAKKENIVKNKEPKKTKITLVDKTIRELNIIDVIFKSQFKKQSEIEWLKWPGLFDENYKPTDDRILLGIYHIRSQIELFHVQKFKAEITKRFEKATNLSLLQIQLEEIKERAEGVRDYYNEYLTDKNEIVKQAREKYVANFEQGIFAALNENSGIIEVSHYYVRGIMFGVKDIDRNKSFIKEPKFNYSTSNHQLAEVCQMLIFFIDKILPPKPQLTEAKKDKIQATILGLFCTLINIIGIDKRDETESAHVYCERICVKYKLPYSDRVRQNYNVNETRTLIKKLTEKVLPLIDTKTKSAIQEYLDSKYPPKQNLYG